MTNNNNNNNKRNKRHHRDDNDDIVLVSSSIVAKKKAAMAKKRKRGHHHHHGKDSANIRRDSIVGKDADAVSGDSSKVRNGITSASAAAENGIILSPQQKQKIMQRMKKGRKMPNGNTTTTTSSHPHVNNNNSRSGKNHTTTTSTTVSSNITDLTESSSHLDNDQQPKRHSAKKKHKNKKRKHTSSYSMDELVSNGAIDLIPEGDGIRTPPRKKRKKDKKGKKSASKKKKKHSDAKKDSHQSTGDSTSTTATTTTTTTTTNNPTKSTSNSNSSSATIDLTLDDASDDDTTPSILSDIYFNVSAFPRGNATTDVLKGIQKSKATPASAAAAAALERLQWRKNTTSGVRPAQLDASLMRNGSPFPDDDSRSFVYFFGLEHGKFLLHRLLLRSDCVTLYLRDDESARSPKARPKCNPQNYEIEIDHQSLDYIKYNEFIGTFIIMLKRSFRVWKTVGNKRVRQKIKTQKHFGNLPPNDSVATLQDFDITQQIFISIKELDELSWSTLLAQWTSLLRPSQIDTVEKCDIYYIEDRCKRLVKQYCTQEGSRALSPVKKGRYTLRNPNYCEQKAEERRNLNDAFWKGMYEHESTQRSQNEIKILIEKPNEVIVRYGGIQITNSDLYRISPGQYLNDNVLDFFLIYFMNHYEKQTKAYVYNTQFYPLLKRDTKKCALTIPRLRQDRKDSVRIFEKDFLFIPTNEGEHWSLFVVCYPGVTSEKNPRFSQRCILSCDSLGEMNHGVHLDTIRQYLRQRFAAEKGSARFPDLPLHFAQMPQQENHFDCGFFLLSFVEFFLKHRLKNYKRVNVVNDSRLTVVQKKNSLDLRESYRERLLMIGTNPELLGASGSGTDAPSQHNPLHTNIDWIRSQQKYDLE